MQAWERVLETTLALQLALELVKWLVELVVESATVWAMGSKTQHTWPGRGLHSSVAQAFGQRESPTASFHHMDHMLCFQRQGSVHLFAVCQ